jgi:hypothetical protein
MAVPVKIVALAIVALTLAATHAAEGQAESYRVLAAQLDRTAGGHVAFVDTLSSPRIVEIDRSGKVAWQWSIPPSVIGSGRITSAPDLEWIAADDTFLLVVPFSGVFRINRAGQVVWRHLTSKISHDADLLPNGNVIYVNGWDADDDAQVTEVDPGGRVVWSWTAKGKVDASWRQMGDRPERRYSFTHANAVQRLPNGDTLVSLRNMHRVVLVGRDGAIKKSWGPIRRVHEPRILQDGTMIFARHGPPPGAVVALRGGERRVVFEEQITLRPIRTVEPLATGNFLLTGGDALVEIDSRGGVLWHVLVFPDLSDRDRQRGVYKAVWVRR